MFLSECVKYKKHLIDLQRSIYRKCDDKYLIRDGYNCAEKVLNRVLNRITDLDEEYNNLISALSNCGYMEQYDYLQQKKDQMFIKLDIINKVLNSGLMTTDQKEDLKKKRDDLYYNNILAVREEIQELEMKNIEFTPKYSIYATLATIGITT